MKRFHDQERQEGEVIMITRKCRSRQCDTETKRRLRDNRHGVVYEQIRISTRYLIEVSNSNVKF